jgi:hypothetical protein
MANLLKTAASEHFGQPTINHPSPSKASPLYLLALLLQYINMADHTKRELWW